eukprot:3641115-Rhodomonas_salina.2
MGGCGKNHHDGPRGGHCRCCSRVTSRWDEPTQAHMWASGYKACGAQGPESTARDSPAFPQGRHHNCAYR